MMCPPYSGRKAVEILAFESVRFRRPIIYPIIDLAGCCGLSAAAKNNIPFFMHALNLIYSEFPAGLLAIGV
jgi:hypothetical protein